MLTASGLMIAAVLQVISVEAIAESGPKIGKSDNRPLTTYERFLPLAIAGDPDIQHFLGFMFFYGEGVDLNYDEAHYWFHLAAEEGDSRAQRNLGIFHSRAVSRIPEKYYDPKEANLWFSLAATYTNNADISRLASQSYGKFLAPDAKKVLTETEERQIGETVFLTFCAGCHGFDGHAAYPSTPSFALGERLKQSDSSLVDSILNGKGLMPPWGDTLSEGVARKSVSYIRTVLHKKVAGASQYEGNQTIEQQFTRFEGDQLELGENIYLQFCGGCHGFNGIAWYVNSPSFALRERMEKHDSELANSIKNGRGEMPSWEYMLLPHQIDALVKFIRTLSETYESGIISELQPPPEQFFRFRPKSQTGPEWIGGDARQ